MTRSTSSGRGADLGRQDCYALRCFENITFSIGAAARGFQALVEWSSVDRLGQITSPTLITVGRFDVVTSWPQAHRTGWRVPHAHVAIFEESGHVPWIDELDMFFSTVTAWLDRDARRLTSKR